MGRGAEDSSYGLEELAMILMRTLAIAGALLLGQSALAQAPAPAPDALVRQISDDVIASIRDDAGVRAGDPGGAAALVETKVVPHFDFRRITQSAMGAGWRRATPEQQEALTGQFKQLLVRTYSSALSSYRGQTIEVRPLRAKTAEDEATVRSVIKQSGAEPITVEYDLERSDGAWKIVDVRVAGMSLVASYRTTFAEEVRNHGVEGLIGQLAAKNRDAVKTARR
jgi:phospholipid transport system substrate-binding protein